MRTVQLELLRPGEIMAAYLRDTDWNRETE